MRTFKPKDILIAAGETESNVLAIEDTRIFMGFIFPDGFTGSSMMFKASIDGTSFNTMYNIYNGKDVSVRVTKNIFGKYCPVMTNDFLGIQFIKFISISSDGLGEHEDRIFKTFQRKI